MGGFEGSDFAFWDGRRIDCIGSTHHDERYLEDYRLLFDSGIRTVRDSFRWAHTETAPGIFDWSAAGAMLESARNAGAQGIWDLCHFGVPCHVDVASADFPQRLANYAFEAAFFAKGTGFTGQWWCPVNEISYWAHAAGEQAFMAPALAGEACFLKRQFVAAFLAARKAILAADPCARFISTDPMIYVLSEDGERSHPHIEQSFEACDMLMGLSHPELGGARDCLDVLGVNYYANNQWTQADSQPLYLDHQGYRPLRCLLSDVWERYRKPVIVSETGAEGHEIEQWLTYVLTEVEYARASGVPVEGVCIYPVMDYPGWTDGRHCRCGLIGLDGNFLERSLNRSLAESVRQYNGQHTEMTEAVAAASPYYGPIAA